MPRIVIIVIIATYGTLAGPLAVHAQQEDQAIGPAVWTRLQHQLTAVLGESDAVMISSPAGMPRVAVNEDRLLVPASILKLLTALTALKTLGETYHFPTDFYLSETGDLKIKGYGDPLQISEELETIAMSLSHKINEIEHLILDDSYFEQPIVIPGRSRSVEPYDAPNGALCVNFNTVAFKRQKGQWVSAEPQTPLLPLVMDKIKASGLAHGRITLAGNRQEGLRYAGELYRHFISRAGIKVKGRVTGGMVNPATDTLLWRYESPYDLAEVVENLLAYSNNFIANQLVLALGAQVHGPPATLEKGLQMIAAYATTALGLTSPELAEGSGLSRRNRISARDMIIVLNHFYPFRTRMRRQGDQWYKTGTLNGINTRAGYLQARDGVTYRFVIMRNSPGKSAGPIMGIIEKALQ